MHPLQRCRSGVRTSTLTRPKRKSKKLDMQVPGAMLFATAREIRGAQVYPIRQWRPGET